MAKGEKRGNREAKKKKVKPKTVAAAASPFTSRSQGGTPPKPPSGNR